MALSSIFDPPVSAEPFRVLTVCTGNVCRSPLAEGLLRMVVRGVPVEVASAGTAALVGAGLPEPQLRIAEDLGVPDARTHRARRLTAELLRDSDLVLALSREHRRRVVELLPRASRRAFTLREFARIVASGAVDDSALRAAAGADRLRESVDLVAQLRGTVVPPEDPLDDDVVDPYGRSEETYRRSAAELIPAVNEVASFVRRIAEGA